VVDEPETEGEIEAAYLEKVRQRAYTLWLQDGQQDGKDQEYWFQAEQEVAEEEGRTPPSEPQITAIEEIPPFKAD